MHLLEDIKKIEQPQRWAMKYNYFIDYVFDYNTQLPQLRVLPPMYIFEISDILFFIKISRTLPTILALTLTFHSLFVIPDPVS